MSSLAIYEDSITSLNKGLLEAYYPLVSLLAIDYEDTYTYEKVCP